MSSEAGNENCFQESPESNHSEVGDQLNNLNGGLKDGLQQNVDSDNGNPLVKHFGCDIETIGDINPSAEKNVHEEPVLVVTPEWQRRSWLLEVSQSAEDSPESVTSVNSDNKSDGGSWTFEDGPDANLKSYELHIQNLTCINEALKASARAAEKEQSDRDKAFKEQVNDNHFRHAESMQALQDKWDAERREEVRIKNELGREYGHLKKLYNGSCKKIKDQTEIINDLDANLSRYAEVVDQVKAPDGSIYTHKQRQDTVEYLKRDANAQKEFYKNQIKTLENQVARKMARIEKGVNESRDLQNKLESLSTELSDGQEKYRDVEAKLELERKSHVDTVEISKRNLEARARETQTAIECRDNQILHMDSIVKNLQAHLVATQQSYAAAMGTAENLHRAHEKSSEEKRELIKQHHHAIQRFVNEHQSACESHSRNEAALKEEIASLKRRLRLIGDSCSYDSVQQKATDNAMQHEIVYLHAAIRKAEDTLVKKKKKDIDTQLPCSTMEKKVNHWKAETLEMRVSKWKSEVLDALAEADAKSMGRPLDKGKGIADNIAERRSGEAFKDLWELPNSEFSKLQATFRKGMAEAGMGQGTMAKPTSEAVHLGQPQPSRPKSTPMAVHSDKSTQTSQGRPTSAPGLSDGQPRKLSTVSKTPISAIAQPENQFKETPPVVVQASRSFSIHGDTYWFKPQSAPVKVVDEVPVSSADIERSRPTPLPIAKEQKETAPANQSAAASQ
ncbi:hypothetical protein V493_04307 [Pseudogymnoascus sp. VKM F-4281 (FW-2241)]|nr:hypothetical protein V493_04307 [Pseudogymnoascus sp. VKM F-4281 (FW-2241)]